MQDNGDLEQVVSVSERRATRSLAGEALARAVAEARRYADVSAKTSPVRFAVLSAEPETLRVRATDLVRFFDAPLPAEGGSDQLSFAVAVEAKRLHEAAKFASGRVEVEIHERVEEVRIVLGMSAVCDKCGATEVFGRDLRPEGKRLADVRRILDKRCQRSTGNAKKYPYAPVPCGGTFVGERRSRRVGGAVRLVADGVAHAVPAFEAPSYSYPVPGTFVRVAAPSLRDLLAAVVDAASDDTTRSHLFAVRLSKDGARTRAVATDGHRLHVATLAVGADWIPSTVCLPKPAAEELLRAATAAARKQLPLEVACSERYMSWRLPGGGVASSVLPDLVFPPYEQVIPRSPDRTIEVDRDALAAKVESTGKAADETKTISLAVGTDMLTVSAKADGGVAFTARLAVRLKGPETWMPSSRATTGFYDNAFKRAKSSGGVLPFEIGFNSKYLADALRRMRPGPVRIGFNDPLDAACLRQEAGEDNLFVVMPSRL